MSRLITANNPESGLISYVYDENGNLVQKKDARNVKTNYVYDALNRVTDRSYQDESPLQRATLPVKYIYDSNNIANSKGKLTKVITGTVNSPFAVTEYQEFDLIGRVKKSQQTTDGTAYNPMEYTYNLSGTLIEQKYPSGRVVKNTLDNDGDLSMVQSRRDQNAGLVAYAKHFTYTAAGAVASMQLGNGAWESTVFNNRLQPTQIALGSVQNGTNKLKLDFTYNTTTNGTPNADNNGNVLTQTITTPSETRLGVTYSAFTAIQTYQYDALNRIKEAEEKIGTTQQWKQTFVYDRYGNRTFDEGSVGNQYKTTTLPRNCGTAPNLVCSKDNPQAIAANNKLQGIEYDSAGNTKTDLDNRRFTYDGENKQIKVETTDGNGNVTGTLGEYFYDGDGKRVKKVSLENSQWITTIFVYDASGQLVGEYSTQTSTSPQVSYLTNDHLGSPRVNTDAIGNVTARHDYQPFGEEVQRASHGTDQVRQKFTSYERDNESDLDFAQARMYVSKLGRFASVDEPFIDQYEDNPQSWNLYLYVRNNPLNLIDPTGLSACDPEKDPNCPKNEDEVVLKVNTTINCGGDGDCTDKKNGQNSIDLIGRRGGRIRNQFDRTMQYIGEWLRFWFRRNTPPRQTTLPTQTLPPSGGNQQSRPNQVYGPPSPPIVPPYLSSRLSQKQKRHVRGSNQNKSYFNSQKDAEIVFNAIQNGSATYLGTTSQGHYVYRYNGVTGYNNNPSAGYTNQPTNVFMLKGNINPSIVPTNPSWTP